MSDALTDILRDEERENIRAVIAELEEKFYKRPTKRAAKELIRAWRNYLEIPRGYQSSSDHRLAYAKIAAYTQYVRTGEYPFDVFPEPFGNQQRQIAKITDIVLEKRPLKEPVEIPVYRAVGGHGDWMADIDEIVALAAEVAIGRSDAVKMIISEEGIRFEELTCDVCPFFRGCDITDRCKGFVEEVLTERRKRFTDLVQQAKTWV